jgi:hypothetical protein
MEINEFAKGLPWRKVLIKAEDRLLEKDLPTEPSYSASAVGPDGAGSGLENSLDLPNSGTTNEEPTLSAADSTCRANETVSVKHPVIPRLLLGFAFALSLAIAIPWLFVGKRIETKTATSYDEPGRTAFSRPAMAGATITEETNSSSGHVVQGAESTCLPGLSRPSPLNAAIGPHRDPSFNSDRTPGLSGENQFRPHQPLPDAETRSATLEALSKQLQKIETQHRECEVVLRLLNSEAGTFAGFVPEDNLTGVSYLARFQEKVVQLEINKRALAVKFTPGSREILAIDLEIQGIKAAMRECVEANLRFLKKDKEALLAHKAQLEGTKGPVGTGGAAAKPRLSDQSDAERSWFSVSGGIDAVGRGLRNALAYASPAPGVEPAARQTRDGSWSHLAASGPGKGPKPEKTKSQENPNVGSRQSNKTISGVPHRAIGQTVTGEAKRPVKIPVTSIRSQVVEQPLAVRYGR